MHWRAAHLPDAASLPMTKLPLARDSGSHQKRHLCRKFPQ